MKNYLKNCKHRVNVNGSFSERETIISSVPQESIRDSLSFNIFLNDLFLVVTHSHLNSYANYNTPYCFGINVNDVNEKLRIDLTQEMVKWKLHGIKCW